MERVAPILLVRHFAHQPDRDASLYTTYAYDALNRVTQAGTAVGTTTNAYTPWHVTTTDMNGKAKDFSKDAYGQLVNVVEHNSGNNYTTTYAWDAVGNLSQITDALSNVRNFTYDGLGSRLTAQDLHASGDGTFGTWNYSYDDAGNTTQTVDPKSQTVNYTYDANNRPLTEDYTGAVGHRDHLHLRLLHERQDAPLRRKLDRIAHLVYLQPARHEGE